MVVEGKVEGVEEMIENIIFSIFGIAGLFLFTVVVAVPPAFLFSWAENKDSNAYGFIALFLTIGWLGIILGVMVTLYEYCK